MFSQGLRRKHSDMSFLLQNFKKIATGFVKNGFNPKKDVVQRATYRVSTTNQFIGRSHTCGELREDHAGEQVELCGWLQYSRMGYFCTLRDSYGSVQIVISQKELQGVLQNAPLESVLKIRGKVQLRPDGQANQEMVTGDIEVECDELEVLNECTNDLPFPVTDHHKVKEHLRMEYRFLDLRNTFLQKNLRLRSDMIFKMRDFLCNVHGFVDVETPTLFRKTPGGAREFVVPTHHRSKYFTLPQSPQQFKQLLMVGGIDRYMQIAKCYRDEGAKPDRQPEFTQLDIEMSFVNPDGIKDLIEQLLRHSWPAEMNHVTTPFQRMTYHDAMMQYGSDKPDTRLSKLTDISELVHKTELEPIQSHLSLPEAHVMAVTVKAGANLTKTHVDQLRKYGQEIAKRHNTWFTVVRKRDAKTWSGEFSKQLGIYDDTTGSQQFDKLLDFEFGDVLLIASGLNYNASETVSKLRAETIKILNTKDHQVVDSNKFHFLWVEDFPLFLPTEDGSEGLESAHHPFTAPRPDDLQLLYTDPLKVTSQHYDLVLNGSEVGGGSIRIHDSKLQRYVLTEVLKEDTKDLEHLLHALDFGCPPHGGIALGLDRLFAILCSAPSIRDVIAFPKSSEGFDLMSKAPAELDQSTKDYYHLS